MEADLYDTDILAWSAAQAERLRRLAGGERVNDLDWVHLIEEVEGLGRSELRAAQSLAALALLHALKIHAFPEHPAVPHWRQELATFLDQARAAYQPSMARKIDVAAMYARARRQILFEHREVAEPRPMPEGLPLDTAGVMSNELTPEALLALLAA